MSQYAPNIAAVIPAYQAAPSVGDVVRRSLAQLSRVVVVDDGSTDGTGDAARDAGATEVLVHEHNRGKGAGLRTAMTHLFANGVDYVATLDADGQHLPEELPKLLAMIDQEPGLVLGVRSQLFAEMGRVRRTSNKVSSHLISLVAGQTFSDIQTGFRLYHRDLFEAVGMREDGFDAESAVVVRACRKGLKILTTPIELGFVDGRCTSHYRPLHDSVRIARAVIGARLEGKR